MMFCNVVSISFCCTTVSSKSNQLKKIEFATYSVNTSLDSVKNSPTIRSCLTIDASGVVRAAYVGVDSIEYDSLKLVHDELEKIEQIFNEGIKLNSFMVKNKLDSGEFFAGDYEYVRTSFSSGAADSLSYIEPFMSQQYKTVLKWMLLKIRTERHVDGSVNRLLISSYITNTIFESYRISKYLPVITALGGQKP